jgi:hypothetical protein
MQNNARQPAQYLIDEIHRSTKGLCLYKDNERRYNLLNRTPDNANRTSNTTLSFTWVAGHMNSIGNERADALAKEAAEFGSSPENVRFSGATRPGRVLGVRDQGSSQRSKLGETKIDWPVWHSRSSHFIHNQ